MCAGVRYQFSASRFQTPNLTKRRVVSFNTVGVTFEDQPSSPFKSLFEMILHMKAWDEKNRRFRRVLRESATQVKPLQRPLSSVGGGTQIFIEGWNLLQSTLLCEHCLLFNTQGAQCFGGMLHFSCQIMLHVSFLDLISRCRDTDRKRRLSRQKCPLTQ